MLTNFVQPEPNVRVLEVGKNKLYMKRTDPHGFIRINYERGELPQELDGQFTSFEEAKKRIDLYLQQKGREIKKSDDSA